MSPETAYWARIRGAGFRANVLGAVTRAGTNCGSCRPEIRTLLRRARLGKKAA